MRLLKKDTRIFLSFIIILLFLTTGSTQFNKYLPTPLRDVAFLPSATPALKIHGASTSTASNKEVVKVTRIIDGDTIQLEDGRKLRYIGIDSPESADPRKSLECFGNESSKRNYELVYGKSVRLEKDISEIDRYKRLLRYVYVDDIMINELLIKEGYAQASSYPPDIKYQNKFTKAEQDARENKRGLWGNCTIIK